MDIFGILKSEEDVKKNTVSTFQFVCGGVSLIAGIIRREPVQIGVGLFLIGVGFINLQ